MGLGQTRFCVGFQGGGSAPSSARNVVQGHNFIVGFLHGNS